MTQRLFTVHRNCSELHNRCEQKFLSPLIYLHRNCSVKATEESKARIRTSRFTIMLIRSKVEKKEGLSNGNKPVTKTLWLKLLATWLLTRCREITKGTQFCVMFVVHF